MKIAVIGAGPAGWAASSKLVELGHEITVFVGNLTSNSIDNLDFKSANKKLNLKLLHGSNYPYRHFPTGPRKIQLGVNLPSSFAFSGLSLVWGATMLPYNDRDLQQWPISTSDLDAGYKYLLDKIPITGRHDGLTDAFRAYFNQGALFPTKRILNFFEMASQLDVEGLFIGSARLAVQTKTRMENGCNYCGKCLIGCPTDKIWFSPQISNGKINYIKNFRILSIIEGEKTISLNAIDMSGEETTFSGFDKVLIGAGNTETFRILAQSNMVPPEAINKDSATFFIPFLLSRKYGPAEKYKNTLSQAFIRYETADSKSIQLQIYDYSDDLITRAKNALPLGKYIPSSILKFFLARLFVGIGYLDSQYSSEIQMRLESNGDVSLHKGRDESATQKLVISQFLANSKNLLENTGLRPLRHLIQHALPGEGVHSGGWLPMGVSCDVAGRPHGTSRVHVIDSSTFPTIPAGAITYTVMANAVRIAELVAL